MKKISTVLMIAGLTGFVFAQKGNSFAKSYNEANRPPETQEADPGGGGPIGGDDPVPIDGYIPVLAAAGFGLAVYFGRRKYILKDR